MMKRDIRLSAILQILPPMQTINSGNSLIRDTATSMQLIYKYVNREPSSIPRIAQMLPNIQGAVMNGLNGCGIWGGGADRRNPVNSAIK